LAASVLLAIALAVAITQRPATLDEAVVSLINESEHALLPSTPVGLARIREPLVAGWRGTGKRNWVGHICEPMRRAWQTGWTYCVARRKFHISVLLMPNETLQDSLDVKDAQALGIVVTDGRRAIAIIGALGEFLEEVESVLRRTLLADNFASQWCWASVLSVAEHCGLIVVYIRHERVFGQHYSTSENFMQRFLMVALLAAVVSMTGCNQLRNQDVGTVLGGAIGGLIGAQVGSGSGQLAAVAAGALLGGLVGNNIGRSMDELDHYQANQALETTNTGYTSSWKNPDSGTSYSVTPTRTYESDGTPCREYTTEAWIDGEPETVHGTACRQPDGSWTTI